MRAVSRCLGGSSDHHTTPPFSPALAGNTMNTTINIDLGAEAADSLEFVADVIERELNRLDQLEEAAPGSSCDDPDFHRWCHQIRGALVALRGLGLLMSNEQARMARHLWYAAADRIVPDQESCSTEWRAALQRLDDVLPRLEKTEQ